MHFNEHASKMISTFTIPQLLLQDCLIRGRRLLSAVAKFDSRKAKRMEKFLRPQQVDLSLPERAPRYAVAPFTNPPRVNVLQSGLRHGNATLLGISNTGCSIRTHAILIIGEDYDLHIDQFGLFPSKIVRNFDGFSFGVRFLIAESVSQALEKRLREFIAP